MLTMMTLGTWRRVVLRQGAARERVGALHEQQHSVEKKKRGGARKDS
jgi:hypothetical protein